METSQLFSYANSLAMIGWLLLIFAPKWKWTKKIIFSGGLVLLFSTAYLLVMLFMVKDMDVSNFSSLEGVMKMFAQPEAVLLGWIHYLAFDLFVGMWEVSDAQKHGIPHIGVIPCLLLTFMLGPVGLLAYFLLRLIIKKGQLVENF